MADQPQSFGQWIQQNANRYPALTAPSSKGPDFSAMPKLPGQPDGPGDVLSSLVDIISRPLFAVTETIDSGIEMPDDFDAAKKLWDEGDGWGAVGAGLGSIGKVASAPIRGMFSTNKDDKRTFSDLIEKQTDEMGTRYNPAYEDTENNVNPVLKGVVGLAGDIAADPLTWVPGAAIASVLKSIPKAAKLLSGGAKAAEEVGEVAAEMVLTPPSKFQTSASGETEMNWGGGAMNQPVAKPGEYAVYYDGGGQNKGVQYFDTVEEARAEVNRFVQGGFKVMPNKNAKPFRTKDTAPSDLDQGFVRMERLGTPTRKMPRGQKPVEPGDMPASLAGKELVPIYKAPDVPAAPVGPVARVTVITKGGKEVKEFTNEAEAQAFVADLKAGGATLVDAKVKNPRPKEGQTRFRIEKIDAPMPKAAPAPGALGAVQKAMETTPRETMSDFLEGLAKAPEPPQKMRFKEWILSLQKVDAKDQPKILVIDKSGKKSMISALAAAVRKDEFANADQIEAQLKMEYIAYSDNVDVQIGNAPASTPFSRFQALVKLEQDDQDTQGLILILGKDLFNKLKSLQSPENFDFYLNNMRAVLKSEGAIDDMLMIAEGSPARLMLERLGIDPATFSTPATEQVAKAVSEGLEEGATPEKMVDTIKTMSKALEDMDPSSPEAQKIRDLVEALGEVVQKNLIDPLDPKKYPTEVPETDVKRTDIEYSVGLGNDVPAANTHFGWDLFMAINRIVTKRVDSGEGIYRTNTGKKLGGIQRAAKAEEETLELMRMAEDFLIANKVPIHFDFNGKQVALTFTSTYQMLASHSPEVAKVLRMVFFNAGVARNKAGKVTSVGTAIAPTKFMEAIVEAVHGGDKASVIDILGSVEKRNSKIDGKPIESFFEGVGDVVNRGVESATRWGRYGHNYRFPNQKSVPEDTLEYRYKKSAQGYYVEYASAPAAEKIADAIMEMQGELLATSTKNSAAYKAQLDSDILLMTDETLESMTVLGNTPSKMAEALIAFSKVEKVVDDVRDAAGAVREGAVAVAKATAKAAVPEQVQEAAQAAVKSASAVRQGRADEAAKISQRAFEKRAQQDRVRDEQLRIARGLPADDTKPMPDPYEARLRAEYDENVASRESALKALDEEASIGDALKWTRDAYADIKSGIMRFLDPMDRIFNAKAGMVFKFGEESLDLYHLRHKFGILSRSVMVGKIRGLRKLEKDYGDLIPGTETSYLAQAFKHLQKRADLGTPTEPKVLAAFKELEHYMSDLLGVPGKLDEAVLGNTFFRNNPAGLAYLNDIFGAYQVLGKSTAPDTIFFDIARAEADRAEALARGNDLDLMSWAADQWTDWDVKDPIEFMSRLNAAAIAMATDTAVSQSFVQMAKSAKLASPVPRAGYARLGVDGKSKYGNLILQYQKEIYGGKDVYYPKELINALRRMDEVARTSRGLDSELGKFISEVFDPIQNTWKYAITLPRPGHHIRNFVGDSSMTYLAEGVQFYARAGNDAFKVMSLRNNYTGVDVMRAINQLGMKDLPKTGDVIASGKYGDFDAGSILDSAMKDGILPPASVIEDVFDPDELLPGVRGGLTKVLERAALRGGKIEDFVSGVSEYRDHYSRLQHYIQFIHKAQKSGKYRTREEMLEAAAKQVLKWHPDVSLLSVSEAKFARRLIPFYSWFRGAVPAIAESMVLNPARFNMFNKASYNLAVAMGVNPDTLYDPFPEDQLFPTFLTEQMEGPQFEIGDAYFRLNPGIATWDVSNMLGPDPIRGIMGATSPLFRVPAEMLSGGSWGTGARINDMSDYLDASIPGVNYAANLTGTSVTGSLMSLLQGRGLDPQFQVAAGNKGPADQGLSALNWLTGAGLQNFSKPNYVNYAEIERRNAEGEQRGF